MTKKKKSRIIKKLLSCQIYHLLLSLYMAERLENEKRGSEEAIREIAKFLKIDIGYFKITFKRLKFALKKAYEIKKGGLPLYKVPDHSEK